MKILGIDPGYERLGIAVLERIVGKKEILLHSECFKTSPKIPHSERLANISKRIEEIINEFKPDALAIEKLFFNTNQKTAIMVAEARGTVLSECATKGMKIFEYTPLQIKIAITGYGRSEKKQIIAMIPRLINMNIELSNSDAVRDASEARDQAVHSSTAHGAKVASNEEMRRIRKLYDDEYDAIAVALTCFACLKNNI